jgi:hypothetical protein
MALFTYKSTIEFLSGLRIQNKVTSISHPTLNGLAEVMNRTILEGLKKKVEENKSK